MIRRRFPLALLLIAPAFSAGVASAKDKPAPPPPAKPGITQMDAKPYYPYVAMAVPNDYSPDKYYPLLYLMPPISDSAEASKPDQYVASWSTVTMKRGWIVASPAAPVLDNEGSIAPMTAVLKLITKTYHIDERRIVVGGYNAGGQMAWRFAVQQPTLFAGVISIGGEMTTVDRNNLKVLVGKPAYIFRGEKDSSYTADMLKGDKVFIEKAGLKLTVEVRPEFKNEFPAASLDVMVKWLDDVWPAGTYRERGTHLEKALLDKNAVAGFAALKDLRDDLKKSPYPAYEVRVAGYEKSLFELARAPFEEAKKLLDTNPVAALEQTDAATKALKGVVAMEKEAQSLLAAIRKDPRVIDALKKRDAEASARKLLPLAEAAEGKGEFAKALELFKKIVALGETSLSKDCADKVAELEKKVGPEPGK